MDVVWLLWQLWNLLSGCQVEFVLGQLSAGIALCGEEPGKRALHSAGASYASASLSEKCSTLVSCRSISVSHTRMLSLVPSNSSLWLVKCYKRGEGHICVDGRTGVQADSKVTFSAGEGEPGVPPEAHSACKGTPAGSGAWGLVLAMVPTSPNFSESSVCW